MGLPFLWGWTWKKVKICAQAHSADKPPCTACIKGRVMKAETEGKGSRGLFLAVQHCSLPRRGAGCEESPQSGRSWYITLSTHWVEAVGSLTRAPPTSLPSTQVASNVGPGKGQRARCLRTGTLFSLPHVVYADSCLFCLS